MIIRPLPLSQEPAQGVMIAVWVILAGTFVRGIYVFQRPDIAQAVTRVDACLPDRPLAALADTILIGKDNPAAQKVWARHMIRMRDKLVLAQPVPPDLNLNAYDRIGLRYMALLLWLVTFMFLNTPPVNRVILPQTAPDIAQNGPNWEGWIEPPRYTGKPPLYLADQTGDTVAVPVGSKITVRSYGQGLPLITQSLSPEPLESAENTRVFNALNDGTLSIGADSWMIKVIPDMPPSVTLAGDMTVKADGTAEQPFTVNDDYDIGGGRAVISLDLAQVDRRHGLAAPPDPRPDIIVDLPVPFNGNRAAFTQTLTENFSKHPFANLPVTLTLSVRDAADQTGTTPPHAVTLHGRRFFQPLAKAIIEQRRDLLWAQSNAPRVAGLLRAISHRPDGFFNDESVYLRLRVMTRQLETYAADGLTLQEQDEIAEALWSIAELLEDGLLNDARERLDRARERLSEAMRNGASPEEIAELMRELREATNDYTRMLAERADPGDGTDQADQSRESIELSMSDLDAMMDRIQELMEQGRMAEAQALSEQMNEILDNMQIAQGSAEGQGKRSGRQMGELLRDQQQLSDETLQNGQRPGGSAAGKQGQDAEGNGGDLAERQEGLRQDLQNLRDRAPSSAEGALEQAEDAMRGAENALRKGDTNTAIDRQSQAIDALREGLRELAEAERPGGSDSDAQTDRRSGANETGDPLGRDLSGNRGNVNEQPFLADDERKENDLADEIRRRAADRTRPAQERGYLERLLEKF